MGNMNAFTETFTHSSPSAKFGQQTSKEGEWSNKPSTTTSPTLTYDISSLLSLQCTPINRSFVYLPNEKQSADFSCHYFCICYLPQKHQNCTHIFHFEPTLPVADNSSCKANLMSSLKQQFLIIFLGLS